MHLASLVVIKVILVKPCVYHVHLVNFKKIPVRLSVNFVQNRLSLVAKPETGHAFIVRQDGHLQRGALNVKRVALVRTVMVVNHAQKDMRGMAPITMLLSADSASWVKRRRRLLVLRVNDGT